MIRKINEKSLFWEAITIHTLFEYQVRNTTRLAFSCTSTVRGSPFARFVILNCNDGLTMSGVPMTSKMDPNQLFKDSIAVMEGKRKSDRARFCCW